MITCPYKTGPLPECSGKNCGRYNNCHGIVYVHQAKTAIRKIPIVEIVK